MSGRAKHTHVEATSAEKPKPRPLSILWQRFVRFGMTPVVMLLYRLRLLGWLTDHWLTVVTHVGRTSGRVRRTVLYVQGYDSQTREVKVVSAWGESDWFKNVRKSPALHVEIGRERYAPEQRLLEAEEIQSWSANLGNGTRWWRGFSAGSWVGPGMPPKGSSWSTHAR